MEDTNKDKKDNGLDIKSDAKADEKKDYEFVTETIKKKPVNKRRVTQRLLSSIITGLIAGATACIIFAYFAPKLYERLNPAVVKDETVPVTIPRDENLTEEEVVSAVKNDSGKDSTLDPVEVEKANNTEPETASDNDTEDEKTEEAENPETPEEADPDKDDTDKSEEPSDEDKAKEENKDSKENDPENEENPDEDDPDAAGDVKRELEVSDYKNLFVKFKELNNDVGRSLATVTLVSDNTDWFMNNYETDNKFMGIILADNGKELLIIANIDKLNQDNEIEVTFCDGKVYKGAIKNFDPSTGLSVVAVDLSRIEGDTQQAIKMAELGNSSVSTLVGMPVMAIGAPLGIEGSMQLGLITSSTQILEFADSNLRYLTTDIYGSNDGSGVIIDLDGKVVGIIFHGGSSVSAKNLIHAYGISDIKSKIEKISNGEELAYLGIMGTDVTPEAIEELGVPKGTYVKQIIVDSPAMRGGIRNGDVIVKFDTTDIEKFSDFKEAMLKCQPGDCVTITVKRPGKNGYLELSYDISLEALQ